LARDGVRSDGDALDQRQADWIDDFLANWRYLSQSRIRSLARIAQPSPEAIAAALRKIMAALRHRQLCGEAPPLGQRDNALSR
jgi:hypothetical protein